MQSCSPPEAVRRGAVKAVKMRSAATATPAWRGSQYDREDYALRILYQTERGLIESKLAR